MTVENALQGIEESLKLFFMRSDHNQLAAAPSMFAYNIATMPDEEVQSTKKATVFKTIHGLLDRTIQSDPSRQRSLVEIKDDEITMASLCRIREFRERADDEDVIEAIRIIDERITGVAE